MKFQKLTIHNIASIEDAVIDFEAKPLSDSEVFLITGKTGAGKSTILDAICLALYATTPRLQGTKMHGSTKEGDRDINVGDPRQIMRRNTGEACVTLTFIGSNGVHYEAKWSVSRARKKVTGNIQAKNWQLKRFDTNTILTKDNDIVPEIRAAVGLDFKQFCRTTMLAQGEFTRFLNSRDDEKAEILEKITGVDIYSKIGAKIFFIANEKDKLCRDAQNLIDGIKTFTDEEIFEKSNQIIELDKQIGQIRLNSDKDIFKRDWLKSSEDFESRVKTAEENFVNASKVVESESFKEKELLIKEWNSTIDARSWMVQLKQANSAYAICTKELEELLHEYRNLLEGQNYSAQELGKIADQIKEIENFITTEKHLSHIYENSQTIVGHLSSICGANRVIDENKNKIDELDKIIKQQLQPACKKAYNEANNAKEIYNHAALCLKKSESEFAALNLSELRANRDFLKQQFAEIRVAKDRLELFSKAERERESNKKSLAERKTLIEEKRRNLADLDTPIKNAKLELDIRREALEKQKDTVDTFSKTLRLKLHIGDICPVCCQNIINDFPLEDELFQLVSGLEEAFNNAEKRYNDLVGKRSGLVTEIDVIQSAYTKDLKAFENDKSVQILKDKVIESCVACGIENFNESVLSTLNILETKNRALHNEIDAKIGDGEIKEKEISKLRKQSDDKRKELEDLSKRVQEAENEINKTNALIATATALIETKRSDVKSATDIVNKLMLSSTWGIDWNVYPKEFSERLITAAKLYNSKIEEKNALYSKQETIKSNYDNVKLLIASILKSMPEWESINVVLAVNIDSLYSKFNSLNENIHKVRTKILGVKDSITQYNTLLTEFLDSNETLTMERLNNLSAYSLNDINTQNELLKKERDEVVIKKTELNSTIKLYEEHLNKKPELTEDDSVLALTERIVEYEKQLSEIREKKGAINQELKSDQENKMRLRKLIDDANMKREEFQKWSQMSKLIGDSNGSKFRKIAQSYVLSTLIHSANGYMKTLTDRYTLKVTPGTFIISVEDAYQGFVSRAISTISGGESFLVSLSLALALSDIGQTLSVNTLFIDEGFGTLSGEPLQNAINTLRLLHNKAGRHVGIISHVEELQERIPVQIQVQQDRFNSSSKIVIVP